MLYILRFDFNGSNYKVITTKNESTIKSRMATEMGVGPGAYKIIGKFDELPHHDIYKIKKRLKDNGFTLETFSTFELPKDWSEGAMMSLVKN